MQNVNVFWYLSNNFGDAVTHYLVKNYFGKNPIWVEPTNPANKYMLTGSILNVESPNTTVWGAGIAWADDIIPNHDIRAVRGSLTLKRLKEYREFQSSIYDEDGNIINYLPFDTSGIQIGDPVLALPHYYNPDVEKKYKIGIIPHYIDSYYFYQNLNCLKQDLDNNGITIIDINSQVEDFVKSVKSCETIISSTLHGIICADAYEVPSVHAKFSNKIGGDGFKYKDWFSNFVNREHKIYDFANKSIEIADIIKIYQEIEKIKWINSSIIRVDEFLESCPLL
jgi:hypothetical protein